VHASPLAREASDHLPVVAQIESITAKDAKEDQRKYETTT
jgi:hypothetical protein